MRRLLLLVPLVLWLVVPAQAQDKPANTWSGRAKPVENQPPERIPLDRLRGVETDELGEEERGVLSDSLSEAQILRRIARLYSYQSDILAAQADGDIEHAEGLLELAMAELATLMQQPDITDRPRFRELYRTLIVEYERYYGADEETALTLSYGDVFALRADMFAMIADVEDPLLENVTLPALPPMRTAVPMTVNRVVERTINYFLREQRPLLERWMARADTYFPMIEQVFAEEGVPDELKYLALVESGLNPRAQSWAKAVGMWQFIAATGRPYGLRIDSWVDERMDPEKATRAAARHLKDLYAMYGNNWHVALAGYNCSPRCIKRAIRKAGGTMQNPPSYWAMYPYLPRETRGYVPQFIAFALIMSNPSEFGLTQTTRGPAYAFERVPVRGMLSLDDIATMAGTDLATIKAFNPELRRASLPPSNAPYMLRLPLGTYDRFAAAFDALPEQTKQPVGEYTVRRGDTLSKIGARYGVSVADLKQANGLRTTRLKVGQQLVVPVPDYTGEIALGEARPETVHYGTRTLRPIVSDPVNLASATPTPTSTSTATPTRPASTPSATPAPKTSNETRVVYRVRRGDTLGKIGQKYGVSVRQIQNWNNLRGTKIRSGQRLTLYTSAPPQPERVVYKVRRGDNLTKIAKKYGVTVSSLRSWNNLRRSTIVPGQRLTIYPGQAAPNYITHKVRRGDSLGKIAKRYGTSVTKLKQWNSLRRSTIHPGQRLKIYR